MDGFEKSAFYGELEPVIGREVYLTDRDGKSVSGVLSVFTANSGNRGWQIGNFPKGGYVIFSPRSIQRVEPLPLLGTVRVVMVQE